MSDLHLYGFETSNNFKVRVALGFKGLAYEFHAIDPADRAAILELSGQPLTPVLKHGRTVLFDSSAILRYLDGNFRAAPRLFPADDHLKMWEIEGWELFGRSRLLAQLMTIVRQRIEGRDDPEERAEAGARFELAVRDLAGALGGAGWLVGDALSAADVVTAPIVHRARVAEILPVPADLPALDDWLSRVMAYDGVGRSG